MFFKSNFPSLYWGSRQSLRTTFNIWTNSTMGFLLIHRCLIWLRESEHRIWFVFKLFMSCIYSILLLLGEWIWPTKIIYMIMSTIGNGSVPHLVWTLYHMFIFDAEGIHNWEQVILLFDWLLQLLWLFYHICYY